ncbi:HypC/HybG/HupF family hydrogenase formation chaperone [Rubeoparvulum massiliense]|uniref:HypC/HybG/HupF family hydrogenase formation chaperone n=1 Tax=Rubeoparvulum massiliense TaxID=1631346 RepID=UPI00065E0817|nr:HypC/HybG/HupF family hydrogenase formation chaperone [Rubeoparvulum massiliense]
MCIAAPGKVIEKKEFVATVDVLGNKMTVGIMMVPDVEVGDYVVIHAGQAMSILDKEEAETNLTEWRNLLK